MRLYAPVVCVRRIDISIPAHADAGVIPDNAGYRYFFIWYMAFVFIILRLQRWIVHYYIPDLSPLGSSAAGNAVKLFFSEKLFCLLP